MTTMVFTDIILGHYLEYVHHIYIEASSRTEEDFIFVIPFQFEEQKDKYDWPLVGNIKFEFLSKEDCDFCLSASPLKSAWRKSILIRKKCKCFKPDKVLLLNLSASIPFLPFFLPHGVKAKGIQYRIYRYSHLPAIRLFLEKIRYMIMAHHPKVESVQILNDLESAEWFNKEYHTTRFMFLPDPVPEVDEQNLRDLRGELRLPTQNSIFLLFGALNFRKGVFETIDALKNLDNETAQKTTMIFAGWVQDPIKDRFYKEIQDLRKDIQVVVIDRFCTYEELFNLCYTCDVILAPYFNPEMSSGVIGYAARFRKPVIGTGVGLLGKLITNYKLGTTIMKVDGESIRHAMQLKHQSVDTLYARTNTASNFAKILLSHE